jgi:TolB protein
MRQISTTRAAGGIAYALIAAIAACHSPTSSSGGGNGALTSLAGRIAFVRTGLSGVGAVQVKPDGTGAGFVVTAPAFVTPLVSAISPDGHHLAVEMEFGPVNKIAIYDLRTGANTPFPADQTHGYDAPSWSPSGTEIAFEDGRSAFATYSGAIEYGRVLVASADGTGARAVGDSAILGSAVTWSHDGTEVLYSRAGVLVSVKADGSSVSPVPIGSVSQVYDPALSPDGTRIALVGILSGSSSPAIIVMNADGTSPASLATTQPGDFHPAWSPDGTMLAIERDLTGSLDSLGVIVVMSANGSNPHIVSPAGSSQFDDRWPSWGPATP